MNVSLKTVAELDTEAENLISDIQQSVWMNIQPLQRKVASNNYPAEIREIITEKERL